MSTSSTTDSETGRTASAGVTRERIKRITAGLLLLLFASALATYFAAFVRETNGGLTFENGLRIPPELLARLETERMVYGLSVVGCSEQEPVLRTPRPLVSDGLGSPFYKD